MGDSGIRHELFAERLATVEVSNEFQKATLKEISQTLKGVVETQAKLANQKEELSTLNADLRILRETVARQETEIRLMEMRLLKATKASEDVDAQIEKLKTQAIQTKAFTRQVAWTFTFIVAPIVLWLLHNAYSYISPVIGQ